MSRLPYPARRRAFDLLLAVSLLILLSPVLFAVALLVRVRLGRSVLFRQERAGLDGRPFVLIKFRSMADRWDDAGNALPDADRLSPFGRWLRSTSLDEIPELWNVVRGEMSLVGPRPLPLVYLPRYTTDEVRRLEVRPGITGWAQVNGRNATTWDRRLAMDVWYVNNRSLWLDLCILARTAQTVLRRDGVSADGHPTMPEFRPDPES